MTLDSDDDTHNFKINININMKDDPAVRLTTNACRALANEMDSLDCLLYRARQCLAGLK